MHTKIATAIVLSLAFAPQQRGWVSSVTGAADATGTVQLTVRGTNPCGAVNLDYGDGSTATTHAITQLPVTLSHDYNRVGEYTVRARGQGNCDGDVFTRINVTRVRGGIFGRNQVRLSRTLLSSFQSEELPGEMPNSFARQARVHSGSLSSE